MWVITGPFDGETQKSKLLKPGKTYVLGRKDRALTISDPKVSRDHLSFVVAPFSETDAQDPESIPLLHVHNLSKTTRRTERQGEIFSINPKASQELLDDDIVHILLQHANMTVSVKWEKVVCYASPHENYSIPVPDCAKLGISAVLNPHENVTHHLTSTYSLTPSIASSLISSAHLVKPDWLTTILEDNESASEPSPLERNFSLPRVVDFHPNYSLSIPSTLKAVRVWEPDEARMHMFKEFRVIFVGQKGREISSDYRTLVKRGDAEYECCSVDGGKKALHTVLAKGKGKSKKLVLVADEQAMGLAIGEDDWMEFVREAASFNLKFIRAEKLTQAVVHVDPSYIDCETSESQEVKANAHRFDSPLPDVVPNTHIDEPSYPQATPAPAPNAIVPPPEPEPAPAPTGRGRLARRLASRQPSEPPQPKPDAPAAVEPAPAAPAVGGGRLRRRMAAQQAATSSNAILGVDDPSAVLDGNPLAGEKPTVAPEPTPVVPPSPGVAAPRISRLKRRLATQAAAQSSTSTATSSLISQPEKEEGEPEFKKFKALYDESDPDKVAKFDLDSYKSMFSQTQTESLVGTGLGTDGASGMGRLGAVMEEEEETQSGANTGHVEPSSALKTQYTQTQGGDGKTQRLKRKVRIDDDDIEMIVEEEGTEQGKAKRRAMEGVNAVEPSQVQSQTQDSQDHATTRPPTSTTSKKPPSVYNSRTAHAQSTDPAKAPSSKTKTEKSGAKPGKPDKDTEFLKAVASTKKGKKHEDEFDREFNNLRISKPDIQKDDEYQKWGVLEQFGYDGDLRGNFMVVVEMEVPKRESHALRRGEGRADWQGRPDFKKFKKKSQGERRKPVELVLNEQDEFSMEDTDLFKPSQGNMSNSFDDNEGTRKTQTQRRRTQVVEESSDEDEAPRLGRRKATQASQSSTKAVKKTTTKAPPKKAPAKKSQKLFIDSEGDDDDDGVFNGGLSDVDEMDEEDEPVPKKNTRAAAGSKKKQPAVVMDDSDDDAGFRGRRKR
ncbi:hypothetical protein C8Q75DRAFT_757839 [Abortiporus biennis]|nr:hypothetical protein C8Q75DRAFT_757839 [Abortiporus biennis]